MKNAKSKSTVFLNCGHVLFKSEYHVELYIKQIISKKYRAVLAQFRNGILPLKVEAGGLSNIPLAKRLCEFCWWNAIEDETHFLLYCDHYNELRRNSFNLISQSSPAFEELDQRDQIKILMDFPPIVKSTAGFPSDAPRKRTSSFQTDVSWRHWYAMPAIQALWRRSDRGGCLLWLAASAVVLVTTGVVAGERGLAAVVASPSRTPNWRYSLIYIVMNNYSCFEDMITSAMAKVMFSSLSVARVCYLPKFSILASMFVWQFVCLSVRIKVVSRIQVAPFDQSSPNLTQTCNSVRAGNLFIM